MRLSGLMKLKCLEILQNNLGSSNETGGGVQAQNKILNIGYFADGIWSHNVFKIIANDPNMQICFICVRRGSDDKILAKFVADYGIELFRDCDINSPEFLAMITKFNCDIFVSMSFD